MIDIKEEFDNPQGQFVQVDVYDLGQRNQIFKQKHVDLRSFQQTDTFYQITMLDLDLVTMAILDTSQMNTGNKALEGNTILIPGEQWTKGIVSKQTDRKNWLGLSLNCTAAGPNVTQSILRE